MPFSSYVSEYSISSLFTPTPAKNCWLRDLKPWMMATRMITAAMPQMMPNMVRNVRVRWRIKLATDMRIISSTGF